MARIVPTRRTPHYVAWHGPCPGRTVRVMWPGMSIALHGACHVTYPARCGLGNWRAKCAHAALCGMAWALPSARTARYVAWHGLYPVTMRCSLNAPRAAPYIQGVKSWFFTRYSPMGFILTCRHSCNSPMQTYGRCCTRFVEMCNKVQQHAQFDVRNPLIPLTLNCNTNLLHLLHVATQQVRVCLQHELVARCCKRANLLRWAMNLLCYPMSKQDNHK